MSQFFNNSDAMLSYAVYVAGYHATHCVFGEALNQNPRLKQILQALLNDPFLLSTEQLGTKVCLFTNREIVLAQRIDSVIRVVGGACLRYCNRNLRPF
jgi:hypothetical protein